MNRIKHIWRNRFQTLLLQLLKSVVKSLALQVSSLVRVLALIGQGNSVFAALGELMHCILREDNIVIKISFKVRRWI
jgi:hypothetical protein